MRFRLNPALDVAALTDGFRRYRRVSIADFLDVDGAAALHANLRDRHDWVQVLNSGDKVFELDRQVRAGMEENRRRDLDQAVYENARLGFQYRYETIRVPDADENRAVMADPIADFARFMSSDDICSFLRTVTGADDVTFADAQATSYSSGDFLTAHDDFVPGKNRRAAYVLGLTPQWRAEWGGLLLFHDPDGRIDGMVPSFNRLNLFAVPQPHSVSLVTPSAAHSRYAITGWLRAA